MQTKGIEFLSSYPGSTCHSHAMIEKPKRYIPVNTRHDTREYATRENAKRENKMKLDVGESVPAQSNTPKELSVRLAQHVSRPLASPLVAELQSRAVTAAWALGLSIPKGYILQEERDCALKSNVTATSGRKLEEATCDLNITTGFTSVRPFPLANFSLGKKKTICSIWRHITPKNFSNIWCCFTCFSSNLENNFFFVFLVLCVVRKPVKQSQRSMSELEPTKNCQTNEKLQDRQQFYIDLLF